MTFRKITPFFIRQITTIGGLASSDNPREGTKGTEAGLVHRERSQDLGLDN
jgi:hypothetical protein